MKETVGFIGPGGMDPAMAANLLKAGFGPRVYNRTPDKARLLLERRAALARGPAKAAEPGGVAATIASDDWAADPAASVLCPSADSPHRPRSLAAAEARLLRMNAHTHPVRKPASAFGADAAKLKQWQAFVRKGKLDVGGATLEQVCFFPNGFLMPPARAAAEGGEFGASWPPGGAWSAPAGNER